VSLSPPAHPHHETSTSKENSHVSCTAESPRPSQELQHWPPSSLEVLARLFLPKWFPKFTSFERLIQTSSEACVKSSPDTNTPFSPRQYVAQLWLTHSLSPSAPLPGPGNCPSRTLENLCQGAANWRREMISRAWLHRHTTPSTSRDLIRWERSIKLETRTIAAWESGRGVEKGDRSGDSGPICRGGPERRI
jgi:hypothetical protein